MTGASAQLEALAPFFFYKRNSMASERQRKHGLTSTMLVVLPEEHQHEYEEVLRGFHESFQPHGAAEEALVLRLAQAHWRSLRSRRVETGILNITAATERARARKLVEDCPEHLNPHNAIAVGFMTNPEERWRMYLRYDGAISRDFFHTLDALMRLQRARQRTNPDPKPLVAAAGSGAPLSRQSEQQSNDTQELSDSGIRSVSQNSPKASALQLPPKQWMALRATKDDEDGRPSGADYQSARALVPSGSIVSEASSEERKDDTFMWHTPFYLG
jgi:hypothetical protein